MSDSDSDMEGLDDLGDLIEDLVESDEEVNKTAKIHIKELIENKPVAEADFEQKVGKCWKRFGEWGIVAVFIVVCLILGAVYIVLFFVYQEELMNGQFFFVPYVIYGLIFVFSVFVCIICFAYIEGELLLRKRAISEIAMINVGLGLLYFFSNLGIFSVFGILKHIPMSAESGMLNWVYSLQAVAAFVMLFFQKFLYTNLRIRKYKHYSKPMYISSLLGSSVFLMYMTIIFVELLAKYKGVHIFTIDDVALNVVISVYFMCIISLFLELTLVFAIVMVITIITVFVLSLVGVFPQLFISFFILTIVFSLFVLVPRIQRLNYILYNIICAVIFLLIIGYDIFFLLVDGELYKIIMVNAILACFIPAFLRFQAMLLPVALIAAFFVTKIDYLPYMSPSIVPCLMICVIFFDKHDFLEFLMEKDSAPKPKKEEEKKEEVTVEIEMKEGEEEGKGEKKEHHMTREELEKERIKEEKKKAMKKKAETVVFTVLRVYLFFTFVLCAIAIIIRTRLDVEDFIISSILSLCLLLLYGAAIEMWSHDVVFPIRVSVFVDFFKTAFGGWFEDLTLFKKVSTSAEESDDEDEEEKRIVEEKKREFEDKKRTDNIMIGFPTKEKIIEKINPLNGNFWSIVCSIVLVVSFLGLETLKFPGEDLKIPGMTIMRIVLSIIFGLVLLGVNVIFLLKSVFTYIKEKKKKKEGVDEVVVEEELVGEKENKEEVPDHEKSEEDENKENVSDSGGEDKGESEVVEGDEGEGEKKEGEVEKKEGTREKKINEVKQEFNTTFLKFALMQVTLFGCIVYFLFPLLLTSSADPSRRFDYIIVSVVMFVLYFAGWKFNHYQTNFSSFFKNTKWFSFLQQLDNVKLFRPMALGPIALIYLIYITKEVQKSFGLSSEFSWLHLFLIVIVLIEIVSAPSEFRLINFVVGFLLFSPLFISEIVKFYYNQLEYFEEPLNQIPLDIELSLFMVLGLDNSFFRIDLKKKPYIFVRNRLLDNDIVFVLLIVTVAVLSAVFTTHFYIFFTFAMVSIVFFLCIPSENKSDTAIIIRKVLLTVLPLFWAGRLIVDIILSKTIYGTTETWDFVPPTSEGIEKTDPWSFLVYLILLFTGLGIWMVIVHLPPVKAFLKIEGSQTNFNYARLFEWKRGHNERFNLLLYILNEVVVITIVLCLTFMFKGYIGLSVELLWIVVVIYVVGDYFFLVILPPLFTAQFYFYLSMNQRTLVIDPLVSFWVSFLVSGCFLLVVFIIGRLTNMFKLSCQHGTRLHTLLFEYYWLYILCLPIAVSCALWKTFQAWPILIFFFLTIFRAIVNGGNSYHFAVSLTYGTILLIFSVAINATSWVGATIGMIIFSFFVLTYLKLTDQAVKKSKLQKVVDGFFTFFCSVYLIVVPIIFSFQEKGSFFWVFEVLYLFYSLWFCVMFASYTLLFIFPLTSGIFVYLLFIKVPEYVYYPPYLSNQSEDAKQLFYVTVAFVGSFIHTLLFFTLSKTGLLYVFRSDKSRKILFFPLWYIFFGCSGVAKAQDVFYSVFKAIEPYIFCNMIKKAVGKRKAKKNEEDYESSSEPEEVVRLEIPESPPAEEKEKAKTPAQILEENIALKEKELLTTKLDPIEKERLVEILKKQQNVTFPLLRQGLSFKSWFPLLWDSMKYNVRNSTTGNFPRFISLLFLVEMAILSFGTFSFGIIPTITYALMIIYCISYKLIIISFIVPVLFSVSVLLNFIYFIVTVGDINTITAPLSAEFWVTFPMGLAMLVSSGILFGMFFCFKTIFVKKKEPKVEEVEKKKKKKRKKKDIDGSDEEIEGEDNDEETEDEGEDEIIERKRVESKDHADDLVGDNLEQIGVFSSGFFQGRMKDRYDAISKSILKNQWKSSKEKSYLIVKALFFILNNSYISISVFLIGFGIPGFKHSTAFLSVPMIFFGVFELFFSIFFKHHFIRTVIAFSRLAIGAFGVVYILPWADDERWWPMFPILLPVGLVTGIVLAVVAVTYLVICIFYSQRKKRKEEEKRKEIEKEEKRKKLIAKLPHRLKKALERGKITIEQIEEKMAKKKKEKEELEKKRLEEKERLEKEQKQSEVAPGSDSGVEDEPDPEPEVKKKKGGLFGFGRKSKGKKVKKEDQPEPEEEKPREIAFARVEPDSATSDEDFGVPVVVPTVVKKERVVVEDDSDSDDFFA